MGVTPGARVHGRLNLPALEVNYVRTNAAARIPLLVGGTTDLDCGTATNNVERQKQVAFTMSVILYVTRFIARKADNLTKLEDLKGKTVVAEVNTLGLKYITELNTARNLGINIRGVKGLREGLPMVESGEAVAFVQVDALLAGAAANHANPELWQISSDALSPSEPAGFMLRKDDPVASTINSAAYSATDYQSRMPTPQITVCGKP